MPLISFIIACLAFTAALLWADYRGAERLRWIAKPAASACFVLAALAAGALDSAYGQWVLAALILCAAGDVLLISGGDKSFLAGMSAFALGHGAYIAAFFSGTPEVTALFFAALAGMALVTVVALRWLWPRLGAFRWPVTGYAAIIAIMAASSFIAAPPGGPAPNAMVIAAAAGFAVSDLSVAQDRFIAPNFFNRVWGLPLYYGAQLLFAASV